MEPSYVPAENEQMVKRIHRISQEMPCLAYIATLPGSIDERIMQIVHRKTADIQEMGL
tara:strand:- start:883 stop:1056 length:174 start_codon:yes stop_codon:yes gene_type:complete